MAAAADEAAFSFPGQRTDMPMLLFIVWAAWLWAWAELLP
jgi:hypothetical protein